MSKSACCPPARRLERVRRVAGVLLAGTLAWAGPSQAALARAAQEAAPQRIEPGTMAARVAACTQCHGPQGGVGADGYYPRLAGKPAEYLYQQLRHFRDGARFYTPMAHLLRGLPDGYLREIADYFAEQHVPYPPPARPAASGALLARGRQLVEAGDAAQGVPACVACHGARLSGLAPAIPGLLGLPLDYIGAQIGSWRSGLRRAAEPDCMGEVARRMAPADVAAVSAWLAALPVTEPYVPEPWDGKWPPRGGGGASADGAANGLGDGPLDGPAFLACGTQPAGARP